MLRHLARQPLAPNERERLQVLDGGLILVARTWTEDLRSAADTRSQTTQSDTIQSDTSRRDAVRIVWPR